MRSKTYAKQLLKDGSLINAGLTTIIFATLYLNPEIWLQDAPPDIQAKVGPKSDKAKRLSILFAIPFFLILFGGVIRSNIRLKQQNGGKLPFKIAFLNAYGRFFYFWLFDLVIIDWLLLVTLKPDFIVLPGTEGMAGYDDYAFHLKAALPALPMMILPSLLIAAFTVGGK